MPRYVHNEERSCLNITHFCIYFKENNGAVIEAAGESAAELSELGILLDDEADGDKTQDNNTPTMKEAKR
jgi:hypothetical protein